jgi:hypothetical protein
MPRNYVPAELRLLVVQRAKGLCEYCLLSQEDTYLTHQIDHLIAIKHGGQTVADNLALACVRCNRFKGSDLTAIDPLHGVIVRLFNPRSQVWHENFGFDGARLVGMTQGGRATVALLQMNDRARLVQRRGLMAVGRYPPPRWVDPKD